MTKLPRGKKKKKSYHGGHYRFRARETGCACVYEDDTRNAAQIRKKTNHQRVHFANLHQTYACVSLYRLFLRCHVLA